MRKRFLLILLFFVLLFVCSSENFKETIFPLLKVDEEVFFPIVAWYGPPVENITEKDFKNLSDCNFTISLSFYRTPEINIKALKLAEKYNIKLIINDSRLNPSKFNSESSYNDLDSVITSYSSYTALFGYYIVDEPGLPLFLNLAKIVKYINTKDFQHYCYINLYPNYADEGQLGISNYKNYVEKFMEIVSPRILSFDNYPILKWGFRVDFFKNLEIIRESSLKYNVPFWGFVRSLETAKYPFPEEGHLRFQVYSNLAYGAKGIQYFEYWPNKITIPAIVTTEGNKTLTYYKVQKINEEILFMSSILRSLKSIDVYHTEPVPVGCKPIPANFIFKINSSKPLCIGYLKDSNNDDFYLLVNRDFNNYTKVDLTLTEKIREIIEVARSKNRVSKTSGKLLNNNFRIKISAGDGRLFKVIR